MEEKVMMTTFAFMSPDEAIMRVMAGPLILGAIGLLIAVPVALWRRNMAIHHPEEWERQKVFEKEEAERTKEALAKAAGVGMKAAAFAMKLGGKYLKK